MFFEIALPHQKKISYAGLLMEQLQWNNTASHLHQPLIFFFVSSRSPLLLSICSHTHLALYALLFGSRGKKSTCQKIDTSRSASKRKYNIKYVMFTSSAYWTALDSLTEQKIFGGSGGIHSRNPLYAPERIMTVMNFHETISIFTFCLIIMIIIYKSTIASHHHHHHIIFFAMILMFLSGQTK